MYFREQLLPTVPLKTALDRLLAYLQSFSYKNNKRIVLVGFNCRVFDEFRLLTAIRQLEMADEFAKVVYGFVDTLPLICAKEIKPWENLKKLTLLDLLVRLKVEVENLTSASNKIAVNEKVSLEHHLNLDEIIQNIQLFGKSLKSANNSLLTSVARSRYWESLEPMVRSRAVSKDMRSRLAENKLGLPRLMRTFKNEGETATIAILENRVNNKPQIIQQKRVLTKILDYLRKNAAESDN